MIFTVSLIEIDWDVISSGIDRLLLLFIFHCWSWILDISTSDIFSEEISFPLPESGESLEKSCWFDVPFVEIEVVKVGRRIKSVGRGGRV